MYFPRHLNLRMLYRLSILMMAHSYDETFVSEKTSDSRSPRMFVQEESTDRKVTEKGREMTKIFF